MLTYFLQERKREVQKQRLKKKKKNLGSETRKREKKDFKLEISSNGAEKLKKEKKREYLSVSRGNQKWRNFTERNEHSLLIQNLDLDDSFNKQTTTTTAAATT